MMSSTQAKGLGRGLSALLSDDDPILEPVQNTDRPNFLPIESLSPNPFQPRRNFDRAGLDELAQSIREKGLVQPILVRPTNVPEAYEIIAGERRWRAAQLAKLDRLPVVVRELSDSEALEIAIIENVQRKDLSPVEEARGYRRLIDEFSHTQDQVAAMIGKSRSHVANLVRLLLLPAGVQSMIDEGRLSMGHARALIGAEDPAALARRVVSRGLNVRQTERLVKAVEQKKTKSSAAPGDFKDPDTLALERSIAQNLGLKVEIHHKGEAGQVRIKYTSLDQLDLLCQRLCERE